MATNMAVKRGKKAQRRKQQVAEKRKAEALEMSLPNRVFRAAQVPIQHCLVHRDLFDLGIGTLVLARGTSPYQVAMGSFLIDVYCLGIKNVMFQSLGDEEFSFYLEQIGAASPLIPLEPGHARKLLRDLAAWSQELGFAPHRDFAVVERLFGDVDANAGVEAFRFGRDGKPAYIPGPGESPLQIRRNVEQLQRALGEDGFELLTAA